jgi:hypothetical protein
MGEALSQYLRKLKSVKFVVVTATESGPIKKSIGSYIARRMGDMWGMIKKPIKTTPERGLLSRCFC